MAERLKYLVSFCARKAGAIGLGSTYRVQVDADSPDAARELGRMKGYAQGLEHIHTPVAECLTHWVYGSGSAGCLFDSGPHVASTLGAAIEGALCIFDDLPDSELAQAKANLRASGIHYFSDRGEAGADLCEVFRCDCGNPRSHDPEFEP